MASIDAACFASAGVLLGAGVPAAGTEALLTTAFFVCATGAGAGFPCPATNGRTIQNTIEQSRIGNPSGKNNFLVRYVLYKKLMATYNPFGAYLESKLLSASPIELVCLAYEGAIEAIRLARVCLLEKRIHDRSRAITKAQLIIGELQRSLDFNHGGQLSPQLASLYTYMRQRLMEANSQQIEAPLTEVENLLESVLESWRALAMQETSTSALTKTTSDDVPSPQTESPCATSDYGGYSYTASDYETSSNPASDQGDSFYAASGYSGSSYSTPGYGASFYGASSYGGSSYSASAQEMPGDSVEHRVSLI